VAKSWYQLVETHLQLDLLRNQRNTNTKVLDLISAHFRAGQAGIADVLQQRQLVEATTGDIAALQADKRVLEHQLTILLGKTPGTLSLPIPHKLPILPSLPETGLPVNLLNTRPDIRSSYLRLQAADYRVAAAVADRLPRLSISADISTTGERAGDLFNNWISSLGANLFGPLIDGGRRKAEVDRTRAVAKQEFYHYGQTVIEAIGEVENSLIQEKEQRKIITSLEIRLQLAADSIDYIAHRYRQGADDYQRVLLALLSHQGLQRTLLFNRLKLINYRIALYRALSGSTPYLTITETPATHGAPVEPTGTQ
jgi:outer membrane protein TolC